MRVVSIGAHSLDAELLGGPLLIKYAKAGAHCSTWHVTQGRLEDPKATEEEKQAYLKKLLDQNKAAADKLGADTKWLGYVSSTMPTTEEFAARLEKDFQDVDLVITHAANAGHPRHVNTHDAVYMAVKNMRLKGSNIKLLYGETFEDLGGFRPQAYFEVTDEELEQWFSALKCYTVFNGGVNDLPYNEYYSAIPSVRQFEVGTKNKAVAYMYASLPQNKLFS